MKYRSNAIHRHGRWASSPSFYFVSVNLNYDGQSQESLFRLPLCSDDVLRAALNCTPENFWKSPGRDGEEHGENTGNGKSPGRSQAEEPGEITGNLKRKTICFILNFNRLPGEEHSLRSGAASRPRKKRMCSGLQAQDLRDTRSEKRREEERGGSNEVYQLYFRPGRRPCGYREIPLSCLETACR